MHNKTATPGQVLQLRRNAVITLGDSENNPVINRVIEKVTLCEDGGINFFTFKGSKTLYRYNFLGIYAITGPTREYLIVD